MAESLLAEGIELMIFGMGTVFLFLTILVYATGLMSSLISRYLPEPITVTVAKTRPRPTTASVDPKVVKIIQAAIEQHRQRD